VLVWIGLQLLGARRLDWTRGWLTVAVYLVGMTAIGIVARRRNPELIAERAKWRRKDTKPFDRFFLAGILVGSFAQPFVAGRESGCLTCKPLSVVWFYAGAGTFALGSTLAAWVMAVNRHAETTVRIQTDRGHKVITTGPYRFVRHPMYVGAILLFVGLTLMWGGREWSAAVALFLTVIFVWRTVLEDRTRYRLVPGLW